MNSDRLFFIISLGACTLLCTGMLRITFDATIDAQQRLAVCEQRQREIATALRVAEVKANSTRTLVNNLLEFSVRDSSYRTGQHTKDWELWLSLQSGIDRLGTAKRE